MVVFPSVPYAVEEGDVCEFVPTAMVGSAVGLALQAREWEGVGIAADTYSDPICDCVIGRVPKVGFLNDVKVVIGVRPVTA